MAYTTDGFGLAELSASRFGDLSKPPVFQTIFNAISSGGEFRLDAGFPPRLGNVTIINGIFVCFITHAESHSAEKFERDPAGALGSISWVSAGSPFMNRFRQSSRSGT